MSSGPIDGGFAGLNGPGLTDTDCVVGIRQGLVQVPIVWSGSAQV